MQDTSYQQQQENIELKWKLGEMIEFEKQTKELYRTHHFGDDLLEPEVSGEINATPREIPKQRRILTGST